MTLHPVALRLVALVGFAATIAAPVLADPPPGHPGTGRAAEILGIPKGVALPHSGRVAEAIDSNDYVYIRVATPDGEAWLAAPRQPVPVGALLRWGDGARMVDFYSRKLHRLFPVVTFVDRLALD